MGPRLSDDTQELVLDLGSISLVTCRLLDLVLSDGEGSGNAEDEREQLHRFPSKKANKKKKKGLGVGDEAWDGAGRIESLRC
jgi:hypothetical protein